MSEDFIKQVRANSPFPWRQIVHPNGVVQLFDASGVEVPLFAITEFAIFITNVMAAQAKEQAA